LNASKASGVELAFPRGNELADEHNLLESKDRKQVRSLVVRDLEQGFLENLDDLMKEAIRLDETVNYKSKRSK